MAALEHSKKTSEGLIAASDWDASHATTETDTAKVLKPDGVGGVAWGNAGVGAAPATNAAALITAYNLFR